MQDDRWFDEFQKRAAPRLKTIFEKDIGGTPQCLVEKIEVLRKKEKSLMQRKEK